MKEFPSASLYPKWDKDVLQREFSNLLVVVKNIEADNHQLHAEVKSLQSDNDKLKSSLRADYSAFQVEINNLRQTMQLMEQKLKLLIPE